MKDTVTLTVASLLSILLFSLHWADEIARGIETGRLSNIGGVAILLVWLCGTLVLAERRSGYIVTLLGSIFGVGVLALHMSGAGLVSNRIVNTGRVLFWVWTLIAMGTAASLSGVLSVRGLWRLRRSRSR